METNPQNSVPSWPKKSAVARGIDGRRPRYLREVKAAPLKEIQVAAPTAAFIDAEVVPHLNLGTQLVSRKRKLVHNIVASLLLADAYHMVISDSRDTATAEVKLRRSIFDQLIKLGFVVTRKGAESAKKQTRYELSFNMGLWRRELKLKFNDIVDVTQRPTSATKKPSEFAPVVVRNASKKPIPFPRVPTAELARIREMECRIMRLNESNLLNHSWIFYRQLEGRSGRYPFQPDITVRSLFNQNFQKGGRLYSYNLNGYTHLPVEERRTMLIDGERIAELDFGGFHTRILYHKLGLEAPEDVYQPERLVPEAYDKSARKKLKDAGLKPLTVPKKVRDGVKKLTNAALNAKGRSSLYGIVSGGDAEEKARMQEFIAILKAVGVTYNKLVDRLIELHEPIFEFFYKETGHKLQAEDVLLLLDILDVFVDQGKPALGLHDAVICRASDAELAEQTMMSCYRRRYGFDPVVTRDF